MSIKSIYLKNSKKHNNFVYIEIEDHLLRLHEGKEGVTTLRRTMHCGDFENAVKKAEDFISEYKSKGYTEDTKPDIRTEPLVFDNAEWHYEGNFPKELEPFQAYVHTGFYIGWLILNNLISDEFKEESREEIQKFIEKKITSVKLYEEQLDGVFTPDIVNEEGFRFTKNYFDFEQGQYLKDYEKTLSSDLPTLYHVKDTWENFQKISNAINQRFAAFKVQIN